MGLMSLRRVLRKTVAVCVGRGFAQADLVRGACATPGASSEGQGSGAPSRGRPRPLLASLAVALLGAVGLLALWSASASAALVHPYVTSFGSFTEVQGVAVDSSAGYVYVFDNGAGKILKFDASGNPVNFSATGTNAITGVSGGGGAEDEIAVDNSSSLANTKGDIYVATGSTAHVLIFSAAGSQIGELTGAGSGPWSGEKCGVAVDPSGDVYVGMFGGYVDKFVPSANPVTNANYASAISGVSGTCNVAADSAGNVFTDTWSSGPVTRYEPSQFGSLSPTGSVVDNAGSSLAIDPANDEVYVDEQSQVAQFGAHGEPFAAPVTVFASSGSGAISGSFGIAVSGFNHDIYVSDGQGHISVFGPPPPPFAPAVESESVTDVGYTEARINARINPDGLATTYHVEYGAGASYGTSTSESAPIGSDFEGHDVSLALKGLAAGTTYHYRVVATNADGVSPGPGHTFTTYSVSAAPGGNCANEQRREEQGATMLPDCRAYEQATPVQKDGTDVQGGIDLVQAAREGAAVTFFTDSAFPGGEGAQNYPTYMSQRSEGVWQTRGLLPPPSTGISGKVMGWNEALSDVYVQNAFHETPTTLYDRDAGTWALQPMVSGGEIFSAFNYAAASKGGDVVAFESNASGLDPRNPELGVYVWDRATGTTRLASVLNDGTLPAAKSFAGSYDWFANGSLTSGGAGFHYYTEPQHVLSEDGGRLYFTPAGSGKLYVRLNPTQPQSALSSGECTEPAMACTIQVSASQKTNGAGPGGTDPAGPQPAAFVGATPTGSSAFFMSHEELTNDATTGPSPALGRANLNGTGANQSFIPVRGAGVAVDGSHIYWAEPRAGTIGRANLDGTNVEPNFITGASNPQGVAVDASHVYWTNAATGTIGRANLDGSSPNQSFITGASNPQGIAVDSSYIYWANAGTNAIARATLAGASVNQSFIYLGGGGSSSPGGVAVDTAHIYWTLPAGNAIELANLNGTSPQYIIFGASNPQGVAVNATNVYWTNAATGTLGRANLNGTSPNQSFITGANGPQGVAVDSAHIYWAGNAGDKGNDLYRFDAGTGTLTDLTPDGTDLFGAEVRGLVGASRDGSYVYFAANSVLAAGATLGNCSPPNGYNISGICNLYVWHEGEPIRFIAQLDASGGQDGSDAHDWAPMDYPGGSAHTENTARVSEDGRTLLFRSQRKLTSYENEGQPELYLYRFGGGSPLCVSCDPQGEPPSGPATLRSIEGVIATPNAPGQRIVRNLSADGNRVFFESTDALLPQDVNRVRDVYEWEAKGSGSCTSEAENGGCLYLLSSGSSPQPSYFADTGASGSDAYIFTRSQLVGQDRDELVDIYDVRENGGLASQNPIATPQCAGEACKGAAAGASAFSTPSSVGFAGAGNVKPPVSGQPKGLSRQQQLQRALKRCDVLYRHHRRQRESCKKRARKRYATKSQHKTTSRKGGK